MTDHRTDAASKVGFLHTAEVHVATFDALSRMHLPSASTVHRVDAEALELAQQGGAAERVRAVVAAHLAELSRCWMRNCLVHLLHTGRDSGRPVG